jgi:hypothetical protein
MRSFAEVPRRAVALLSSVTALASVTLGLGLIQASQAHADTWGCNGLINNNAAVCIGSESEYGQKIEDPWIPSDPNQAYMDQSVIVRRCLTSGDMKCSSDSGRDNRVMRWQIDKVTWVNPQTSEYTDPSQVSSTSPSWGCTSGSKAITTTYIPGNGTTFESFGFLPDVGSDREFHPNWLSKAFSMSAGMLGDLTFGASTPSSWQLGDTETVNVSPGRKAWMNLTPGFVRLKGEAILHMQYHWNSGPVKAWHHKDLRIRDATLVVPHTLSYNGSKFQTASAAFRDKAMTKVEWGQHCGRQTPSPWHHIQIRNYSNTGSIRVLN